MIESLGAASSGVLKGLQTVVVFAVSSALFCGVDTRECATGPKALCVAVVTFGLGAYGFGGQRGQKDR